MSAATKRKHVEREVMDQIMLPSASQQIVRVIGGRGNNLHEVESAAGEIFLVSMPSKFRKNVWVKRGDYLLCEPINEGDKVKAEIVGILYKDNIRYIQQHGLWPSGFTFETEASDAAKDSDHTFPESDEEDSDYDGSSDNQCAEGEDQDSHVLLQCDSNLNRVDTDEK